MAFAKVNDINLYYEHEGSKTPIVFVSGFSTHRETWRKYAEKLHPSCQTVIFDNRGTGQSDAPPPPYSIDQMADDLASLLDYLNIDSAYMVGSSMGTAIILTLALRHSKKIKKGLLIAPFAYLPRTSYLKSETIGKLLQTGVPLELIIQTAIPWLYSSAFLSDSARLKAKRQEMIDNPFPQKPEGYLGQLAALQSYDIRDRLHQIKTEMFLAAGNEDVSTPLYCAEEINSKLPTSHLKVFNEVAHMVHVEKPKEISQLIKQMLE